MDFDRVVQRSPEETTKEIFSLPMYPSLTDNEQKSVVNALHEILGDFD